MNKENHSILKKDANLLELFDNLIKSIKHDGGQLLDWGINRC